MTDNRHVATRAIQAAVKGRQQEVLLGLGIDWEGGSPHIRCPYPKHDDANPSWRWDAKRTGAFCTCIDGSHSIFDVVIAREGIDFERAKIRVAELLVRSDLIRE
jgi:putative DNA primase/helicase